MLHFLDTNILLNSISRSPDESLKRERAIALLDEDSGALSVQVPQEFYVQATRSSRADAIPHEFAAGLIEADSQSAWVFLLGQCGRCSRAHSGLRPALHRGLESRTNGGWSCHYQPFSLTKPAFFYREIPDPPPAITTPSKPSSTEGGTSFAAIRSIACSGTTRPRSAFRALHTSSGTSK